MSIISSDISKAIHFLTKGDIVAIPTETVYGLAGNIFLEDAINKIFDVKQRPRFNPLIVHLNNMNQVEDIVKEFPEKAQLLAKAFWPGPLTLILPKKSTVPDAVTAGKDTVAIRIPDHPVTLELLKQLPFPVAAPSANPFNRISPTKASHVNEYFEETIPMILEGGECNRGIESTIIGFENSKVIIYRLGSLELEKIEEIVGKVIVKNKKESAPNAPGMLAKHYAPKTKIILVDDVKESIRTFHTHSIGVLKLTGESEMNQVSKIELLSKSGNLTEAASNLYAALHNLDDANLDLIIAERFPNYGLGKTINDRLERATK